MATSKLSINRFCEVLDRSEGLIEYAKGIDAALRQSQYKKADKLLEKLRRRCLELRTKLPLPDSW